MPDLIDVDTIAHFWGGDIQLSGTGDLARVSGVERSKQRVLRRLLTNPGTYLTHPDYGGGVPAMVGEVLDLAKIKARVRGQMLLEASVSKSPEPTVDVIELPDGVQVNVSYTVLPTRQPASLSFSVDA